MLDRILRFWRWHPEVALRYLPIVKEIKKKNFPLSGSVLEVGSGWLGISPYLGIRVTGLDEDFENKNYYLTKQVNGTIFRIPFENNSFDIVVCSDVLEHIKPNLYNKAIKELLRVTKKYLYLGIPSGEDSLKQDILLNKVYKSKFGKEFPFLQQHISNGLPDPDQIQNLIKKNAVKLKKKIRIEAIGNENLQIRLFLMNGWITKNIFEDFFYRKIMLLFLPVLRILERPGYYRTIFFVTIEA